MNLFELTDKIVALRARRDALASMLDDQIKIYTEMLHTQMVVAGVRTVETDTARAYARTTQKVDVSDWAAVHTYIARNQAWDMLERRLVVTAVRKRLEAGDAIPGVALAEPVTTVVVGAKKGKEDKE